MKKRIIPLLVIVVLAMLAAAAFAFALPASERADTLREQLALGERYLTECDFESAVLAYKRVLAVDPHNVDAHLALAEAYEKLGRADLAAEALRHAQTLTGDTRIGEALAHYNAPLADETTAVTEAVTLPAETDPPEDTSAARLGITDKALETQIRAALELPEGELTEALLAKKDALTLTGLELPDLTFLTYFSGLRYLYFVDCTLTDLSALAGLPELIWLSLDSTSLDKPASLAKLEKVNRVALIDSPIGDYSVLAGMEKLDTLYLEAMPAADLSALKGCAKLYDLALADCKIGSLAPLGEMPALTSLYIKKQSELADPAAIAGLDGLKLLSLEELPWRDISFVGGMTNLRSLYVDNLPVSDFAFLSKLTRLQDLILRETLLTDLSGLASTHMLNSLIIRHARLTDLSPLASHSGLVNLHLEACHITDLTGIGRLAQVSSLNLADNPITSLEPLSGVPAGAWIGLAGVPAIMDWSPVAHVKNVPMRPDPLPTYDLSGTTEFDIILAHMLGIDAAEVPAYKKKITAIAVSGTGYSFTLADSGQPVIRREAADKNRIDLDLRAFCTWAQQMRLTELHIAGLPLDDITPIAWLHALETLSLTDCGALDLTPLSMLHQLERLDLTGSTLKSTLDPVAHVNSVTPMRVEDAKLDPLFIGDAADPAERIASVRAVRIAGGRIEIRRVGEDTPFSDETGSSRALNMAELAAYLRQFPNLTELVIEHHDVTEADIDALRILGGITRLTMRDCGLTAIPRLEHDMALEYLDLSDNDITVMYGLRDMHELAELNLEGNPAPDIYWATFVKNVHGAPWEE